MVDLIAAPGMSTAGYANISSSDEITHGQVKQAANFAYARIYEVSILPCPESVEAIQPNTHHPPRPATKSPSTNP